jgi:hypothetical protein
VSGRAFLSRQTRAIATLVVGVLAAVSLAGCTGLADILAPEPVRNDTGEVVQGGQSDAFSVGVGDCLGDAAAGQVSDVQVVPCGEPHDAEVFADFQLDGAEYPGAEEVTRLADEGCLSAFEDYVGLPYQRSALEITYFAPTESSWNDLGDRLVSCLLHDPAGPVSGSLKGAAR